MTLFLYQKLRRLVLVICNTVFSNDQEVFQHVRHYGAIFKARVLELVDNRVDADITYKVYSEFFSSLHRILLDKKISGNFLLGEGLSFCLISWNGQK